MILTHPTRDALYVGRFIAGLGVGAASMLTPLYVSENAPRAIRGGMTGCYQLFLVFGKDLNLCCVYLSINSYIGIMMAFWVNFVSIFSFFTMGGVVRPPVVINFDNLSRHPTSTAREKLSTLFH